MEVDKLKRYKELFPDAESKAAAFDRIAAQYYAANFGRMTKADFETLLFDLYLEQILQTDDMNFQKYSDFRLSKELGIPQSRVLKLKEKKHLQYPHEFDWKKSLAEVCDNARYEKGKIKIQIPDINLYYEIKNAIEENGGYIDVSLTPKLLQISPGYFLDLLEIISEEEDRKYLRKELHKKLCEQQKDDDYFEQQPISQSIKSLGKSAIEEFIISVIDGLSGPAGTILVKVGKAIRDSARSK